MDDIRTLPTRSLALLLRVFENYNRRAGSERLEKLRGAWGDWIDNLFLAVGRSSTVAAATTKKSVSFNDVVSIFRTSERGNRSEVEVQTIKRFLVENVTSVPWKELKDEDKNTLANEVDWQPIVGRSIVFLQGDFGNVYYMIGAGTVGLYLEKSEDKQMSIAREFGDYRQKEFPGTDEDLSKLGFNIATLPSGIGFGEVAILSDNHKFRSCAAVSMDRATLLLVVHASTYNKTLRKVHSRQQQMSGAMELLQSLPSFSGFSYATIATLAFELSRVRRADGAVIQAPNGPVQFVYIITSGSVKKVLAPEEPNVSGGGGGGGGGGGLSPRIPQLGVVTLGRGKIIGEGEVYQDLTHYRHGYVSVGVSELFEVPVEVFRKTLLDQAKALVALRASGAWDPATMAPQQSYRAMQEANKLREEAHEQRVRSALVAATEMMGGSRQAENARLDRLSRMLPTLLGEEPAMAVSAAPSLTAASSSSSMMMMSIQSGGPAGAGAGTRGPSRTHTPQSPRGSPGSIRGRASPRGSPSKSPRNQGGSTGLSGMALASPSAYAAEHQHQHQHHNASPGAGSGTITGPSGGAGMLGGAHTTGDISRRLKLAMQVGAGATTVGPAFPALASSFVATSASAVPSSPSQPKPSHGHSPHR